ncbi:MAG: transposase IS200-family protein [Firmicutes bacterium]|nr:transposase IS200-family protein [Bacillota bacterium]
MGTGMLFSIRKHSPCPCVLQAKMKQSRTKLTWEQQVEKITVEEGISQEKLVGKCRIRKVVAARKRLIYEALERDLMTRTQLAKVLQIDPANITRICQELTNN